MAIESQNPYEYRNQASLGANTKYGYNDMGQVVPVRSDFAEQKQQAASGGSNTTAPNTATAQPYNYNNDPTAKGWNNQSATPVNQQGNAQEVAKNAFIKQVQPVAKPADYAGQINQQKGVQVHRMPNGNGGVNILQDVQGEKITPQTPDIPQQLEAKRGEQISIQTEPKDNRSEYQKFRDAMYDEEAIKKRSDRQARILAVGDALRHIGNLYYTSKGASPQKYSTAPATEERNNYETGRQNRDALAYKYYTAKQKADIDKANAESKAALNASTVARNEAQTKKYLQEININAEEYPYKIKSLIADAAYKASLADKAGADAAMAEIDAELKKTYGAKEAQAKLDKIYADINQSNASAANSYSQVKYHNAQTSKTMQDLKADSKNLSFSGYYGTMSRPDKKELTDDEVSSIYSLAKSKGWISGDGYKTYIDGGVDSKHAMIASISDALNEGNPRQRQELTHYLVNQRHFTINSESGKRQFNVADSKINKQTGHKVGAASPTPTKSVPKTGNNTKGKNTAASLGGKQTKPAKNSKTTSKSSNSQYGVR